MVTRPHAPPTRHGRPWALGAGLTGLVVATVLRHRRHETRDEPRVLGLTF